MDLLIADDSPESLRIWEIFLNKEGFSFSTAVNGLEASKNFMEHNYDAVLLDIEMPEMNGLETARFMKSVNPHVPLIAVTGLNSKADLDSIDDAGFDGHICKPINMSSALNKIQGHLTLQ